MSNRLPPTCAPSQYISDVLLAGGKRPFLTGDAFSPADAYLYIMLTWLPHLKLELANYGDVIQQYFKRVQALPFVQAAHKRMAEDPKPKMVA